MYRAIRLGAPSPGELVEWELAEHFHWTLDYIRDGLTVADIHAWEQIKDGRNEAEKARQALANGPKA